MTLTKVVTSMPGSSCFRKPFDSKRVHSYQTLLKLALQHFCPNFPLIQDKLIWKTSLLVRSKILGLSDNTLTANHMYSRNRWEKFPQQVLMILSQKRRIFPNTFVTFLQSTQNFLHFDKKDQPHNLYISEIIDPEKSGSFNAWKLFFKNTLPL